MTSYGPLHTFPKRSAVNCHCIEQKTVMIPVGKVEESGHWSQDRKEYRQGAEGQDCSIY